MPKNSKPEPTQQQHQSPREEVANAATHGIGAALAIAGLVVLVVFASLQRDPWKVVSFSVYGTSLVLLYLASTLYHSFRAPKLKKFFRQMDHAMIYVLIAGSYTPLMLVLLRDAWGWSMFGIVWGLAAAGVTMKMLFIGRFKVVSILVYLAMGWMIVIAWKPMLTVMPTGLLTWIAIGGACYTLGVVFYAWRTFPYHHTVWHLFVLGGSISHWIGMMLYVA
ncbi:hemolysin III family protein [bacterium]|nr:hemolysin III family protein [bacterium]